MIKRLIALVSAVLMILSFAACGGNGDDVTTTEAPSTTSYIREIKTNVAAVKDVTGFGLAKLAKDRDYAYSVTYHDDVAQVKELIKSGKADIAAMNISDAAVLYKEGADIKIIAVNNLMSMHVLTKGVTVREPADLKNKTIYALSNDVATESFVKETFDENGVDYDSLDIQVFENISELSAAIAEKDKYTLMLEGIDAAHLPQDNERKVVLDLTFGWINQRSSLPVHTVVVARTDYITSNPEIIDEFRTFNEVSVNFIVGNAESGALHLYENGMIENADVSGLYVANYCSLGYAEKEKMQKVVGECLAAYGDAEIQVQDITYIE